VSAKDLKLISKRDAVIQQVHAAIEHCQKGQLVR
jgi:hypothetical protein